MSKSICKKLLHGKPPQEAQIPWRDYVTLLGASVGPTLGMPPPSVLAAWGELGGAEGKEE